MSIRTHPVPVRAGVRTIFEQGITCLSPAKNGQGVKDLYYLVPDEGKTIYQCYDAKGDLCYNTAYDNARNVVNKALGEREKSACPRQKSQSRSKRNKSLFRH